MENLFGIDDVEDYELELFENLENLKEMFCDEYKKEDSKNEQDKFLYEGCLLIVGISMFLIMIVVMWYGMIGEVLQDVFILISFYCIFFNYCIVSLRRFK